MPDLPRRIRLKRIVERLRLERQRRIRIRVSVAAYAYEILNRPIMSDAEFDALSKKVRHNIRTGATKLDRFFKEEFSSSTGMWIHKHPNKKGLRRVLERVY